MRPETCVLYTYTTDVKRKPGDVVRVYNHYYTVIHVKRVGRWMRRDYILTMRLSRPQEENEYVARGVAAMVG